MSNESAVKPEKIEIIEKRRTMHLIGCVFYGDPFHSSRGWSVENEIGLTWQRFMNLYAKNQEMINMYRINPNLAYEVHIEPEEYKETKNFYVFVGIEVNNLDKMPLGMFYKILPATMYAVFTFQGEKMFSGGDYIWQEWLPKSDEYQEAYPFLIQAYDETRFKGLDNKASELDYYIPIKLKE
ncbi:MAG: GyrI-like domain-containing protein [Candidatus Hodarchaeota archaeon]